MKFCRKCGAQLNDDAKFCNKCGTQCSQPAVQPQPAAQPQKKKFPVWIIIVAAVIIVAAAATFFLLGKHDKDQVTETASETSAVAQTTAAEVKETEKAVPETEAKPKEAKKETAPETKPEVFANKDFEGYWGDSGGRWGVLIEKVGDVYIATMEGSSSAYSGDRETMTCYLDEDELEYHDGKNVTYQIDNVGNYAEIVQYSTGQGSFEFEDDPYDPYEYENEILAQEWEGIGENARPVGPYLVWEQEPIWQWASDEYIIWYSSDLVLSDMDVSWLTMDDLRIARNEIYARHGRRFNDAELQAHFDSCSWYVGTIEPDQFDDSVLSEIEKNNLDYMKLFEQQ